MTKIGYVEARINSSDAGFFNKLVKEICSQEDLYKSDMVNYINGNVTKKLHLTLFYGCNPTDTNLNLLKEYIHNIKLNKLYLGELFLLPGYQNLYQVLCIKVTDKNNQLKKIFNDIQNFCPNSADTSDKFIPHLTLAYVITTYKLPNNKSTPTSVKVKSIKYLYD